MELFTSARDGDVEGVLHALESGASVNVTRPVSVYRVQILSEKVTCTFMCVYSCVAWELTHLSNSVLLKPA